jgi:hypothetical protein
MSMPLPAPVARSVPLAEMRLVEPQIGVSAPAARWPTGSNPEA